jgi:hypothetical protein
VDCRRCRRETETGVTLTPQEVAKSFEARGFRLLYWKRHGDDPKEWKGPRDKGWNDPERRYPLDLYDPATMNVGIFTGHEIAPGKFLVGVDFDWAPGVVLAKKLLPKTGFGFRRQGKRLSWAFFTVPERFDIDTYCDLTDDGSDGDGQTFVELRGGDSSRMTMAPPSLHSPGVYVEVAEDGDIAHEDLQTIKSAVIDYAIGCLLLKRVPGGLHHEGRLALAGFLLRHGFASERVVDLLEAVCEAQSAVGVPEMSLKDVADCRSVVETTAQRLKNREKKVAGGPMFAKFCGERGKDIVKRIAKYLGTSTLSSDVVVMEGGELSAIVDRAEAALLDHGASLYQRGGFLVRPVRLDTPVGETAHAVRRDAGSMVLVGVREAWLLEEMGRVLRWAHGTKDGLSFADPEMKYPRTLLARGEWRFPVLRGVVTAPTLDRHGRILETPGLDAESGLLLVLDQPFPRIPETPSVDEARTALERLMHPLRAFPFVDEAAKSVALSALLTALVRPSLRTSPLHGFDAPTAGTGKSLLAELAGLLATGCRPPALSQGKSAEEDEKRLSTVLMAGDPVIHIDNCERPIAGDFLCSMLTQETVQARILGLSERRVLPSTALVLASGNNLTFAGDTSRRAVVCRLDAQVERPDTRVFDFDCHAEVTASRAELVVAGLTVLRAYVVAGRPITLPPMGSFADYEWIRAALVWLGCADPAETRSLILDNDPKRDELVVVMDAWEAAVGSKPIEVAEISRRAEACTDDAFVALRDALVEAACRGGVWNAKSVGWWLRRHKDRVVNGRSLRSGKHGPEENQVGREWVLAGAAEPKPRLDAKREERPEPPLSAYDDRM